MMKYILALIFVLFITTAAAAAPFLVCDPFPEEVGVTRFEITIGTFTATSTPVSNALRFDLSSLPTGNHTARVKACNIWGCGEESTLPFTKSIPAGPTSILIVSQ